MSKKDEVLKLAKKRIDDLEWVESARDAEIVDLREKHGGCLVTIDELTAERDRLEEMLNERK